MRITQFPRSGLPTQLLKAAGVAALLGVATAQALAQANATDPNAGRRRGGDRPERTDGGGRGGGSPEMAALQQAIADNLPEAEIKSRLERMRDARRNNEAKVAKAQEDLRAVLTVKQEAIAVMFGLLP